MDIARNDPCYSFDIHTEMVPRDDLWADSAVANLQTRAVTKALATSLAWEMASIRIPNSTEKGRPHRRLRNERPRLRYLVGPLEGEELANRLHAEYDDYLPDWIVGTLRSALYEVAFVRSGFPQPVVGEPLDDSFWEWLDMAVDWSYVACALKLEYDMCCQVGYTRFSQLLGGNAWDYDPPGVSDETMKGFYLADASDSETR
jgi:hypothetical protein